VAWLGKSAWTAASNALVEAESTGIEFVAGAAGDGSSFDRAGQFRATVAKQSSTEQKKVLIRVPNRASC